MPFKSQAQRSLFYAKAARGEIPEKTVEEWEDATKRKKSLPERVKKAAFFDELEKIAATRLDKILRTLPVGRTLNTVSRGRVGQGAQEFAAGGATSHMIGECRG